MPPRFRGDAHWILPRSLASESQSSEELHFNADCVMMIYVQLSQYVTTCDAKTNTEHILRYVYSPRRDAQ